jgi:hypothetical protein
MFFFYILELFQGGSVRVPEQDQIRPSYVTEPESIHSEETGTGTVTGSTGTHDRRIDNCAWSRVTDATSVQCWARLTELSGPQKLAHFDSSSALLGFSCPQCESVKCVSYPAMVRHLRETHRYRYGTVLTDSNFQQL